METHGQQPRPIVNEPDLPTPERWQLGRMEVDGRTYDRAIFVTFATVEEYRAALRQVDGWFNA
jgi:hypothetical protein